MKLNLGCGKRKIEGYENLDYPQIDLNKFPYPYKDNSIDQIVLRSVLEHLDKPEKVMEEFKRILKEEGTILIRVPHFSSIHAWGNLQHRRTFSIRSFNIEGFDIIKRIIEFPRIKFFVRPLANTFPLFYEKNLAYILPATDIKVILKKIKSKEVKNGK